eukprot:768646-Hanusia_phi.AAC.13
MEDREKYHEIGLVDTPKYTKQFLSKKQNILRGKLSNNIDDNLQPHEVDELWKGQDSGMFNNEPRGTKTEGKDEILMTTQLDFGGEETLWDDLEQDDQEPQETADASKNSKKFSEGDIVKYRESDGTFRLAEIVSIDRSIIPHSYGIRLEGTIRETIEERIDRIAAVDKQSANETALVSAKIDPSERFYDFDQGFFLHPLLREANLKRRMKREAADFQNDTLIPMRNVRASQVNVKLHAKFADSVRKDHTSDAIGDRDSEEALEHVLDYTRQAKQRQILDAKEEEREFQRKCGMKTEIRPHGHGKLRQDHRFRRYNR